jgi:hypothetical protein
MTRQPFNVTIRFQSNIAWAHRPPVVETHERTETVWACSRAEARRITRSRFGAPAVEVQPMWTSEKVE